MNPKGIILTGGPNSCYEEGAPACSRELFEMGIPVLGLCYGAQLMMHVLGGHVCKAPVREYGKIEVTVDQNCKLFTNVAEKTICWMSHNDYIEKIAPGFEITAYTDNCPAAAMQCIEKNLYAIQFHLRFFIQKREPRCCPISYTMYADVPATGKWMHL